MAEDIQQAEQPGIIGSLAGRVASGVYEGVKGGVIGLGVGAATGGIIGSLTPDTIESLSSTIGGAAETVGWTTNPITETTQTAVEVFANQTQAVSEAASNQLATAQATNGLAQAAGSLVKSVLPQASVVTDILSNTTLGNETQASTLAENANALATFGEFVRTNIDKVVDGVKRVAEAVGINTANPVETTVAQDLTSLANNVTATQGAAIGAVAGTTLGTFNGLTGNSSAADRTLARENAVQTAQINQLAMATQMLGGAVQGLGGAVMQTQQAVEKNNQSIGQLSSTVDVVGKHTRHLLEKGEHHGVQTGSFVAKEDARRSAAAHAPKTLGA
jgi:hypothetical protein